MVRFFGDCRIKPHAPPHILISAYCFDLKRSRRVIRWPYYLIGNWRSELHGYLIRFDTRTSVFKLLLYLSECLRLWRSFPYSIILLIHGKFPQFYYIIINVVTRCKPNYIAGSLLHLCSRGCWHRIGRNFLFYNILNIVCFLDLDHKFFTLSKIHYCCQDKLVWPFLQCHCGLPPLR